MEASALSAPQAHRLRISISAPLLRLRSDEQLVALFRAGNEDAFRTIHDRYRTRLYAYVRQMLGGSKSDAEDALQDVFLRAYSALRANGREIALRAWLYRVAHNRCIDQLRRPVPQAADVFDVSRAPVADDPSTATERREELRRLVEDVRRLPEQQRSVLLMREMEGLSYADLAAALDISIPAVKSLLVRARMGLVQAAEARDTACFDVRLDLAAAHGRGVRANGRARRHLRDCAGCRAYRGELRGRQKALAGLSPVAGAGPLSVLAQLVGGSGAAGGGAVAGGGGAVVGGSAAAASATKLAIVVGAAVVTAGGAVEVRSQLDRPVHVRAHPSHAIAAAPRKAPAAPTATSVRLAATQRPAATTRARAITAATPTPVHAHRRKALDKATVVDPARPAPRHRGAGAERRGRGRGLHRDRAGHLDLDHDAGHAPGAERGRQRPQGPPGVAASGPDPGPDAGHALDGGDGARHDGRVVHREREHPDRDRQRHHRRRDRQRRHREHDGRGTGTGTAGGG